MEAMILLSTDFDATVVKDQIVSWIRSWFERNGKDCNAVIGISGGKDSTVAAALCVEALGKDRVFGLLMPNGEHPDIDDSYVVCDCLGIRFFESDIHKAFRNVLFNVNYDLARLQLERTEQTTVNLAPRIRMCFLYAYAQSLNGRVVNTCNLSEDYVGYSTKYGDAAGDFAPLKSLTSDEVIAVGEVLGLPEHLLKKAPSDGLCGKTDEDNLGFTYDVLNRYIRTGEISDMAAKERIDRLHLVNEFKEKPMERFILHPEERIYLTEKYR